MDDSRFDSLARSLGTAGSRRRALSGLLAGTLGILGWHDRDEMAAHDLKAKCKKKSGEAKKKCLKKAKKHAATHANQAPPPPPPPPAPTCSDGVTNGGESDIDCGGFRCPRCANGKLCTSVHDCASAYCAQVSANTRCQACTLNTACGTDPLDDGQCNCVATPNSGNLCLRSTAFPLECDQCPNGTAYCKFDFILGATCYKLCGEASFCPAGADFCANGAPTCGADGNGMCLQMIEGGMRCGIDPSDGVACTSDQSCQDIYGDEAFCAKNSGSDCGYPANQPGFCAITH